MYTLTQTHTLIWGLFCILSWNLNLINKYNNKTKQCRLKTQRSLSVRYRIFLISKNLWNTNFLKRKCSNLFQNCIFLHICTVVQIPHWFKIVFGGVPNRYSIARYVSKIVSAARVGNLLLVMEEMILETQGRDDFGDGYLRICVDPLPKEETITGENDDKKKCLWISGNSYNGVQKITIYLWIYTETLRRIKSCGVFVLSLHVVKALLWMRFSQEHRPHLIPDRSQGKWSHSVMFDSLWPHGLEPASLLHPRDFPGKNTGVGCHFLLHHSQGLQI